MSWITALLTVLVALGAPVALAESPEVLGPGDSIRVTVYQNPDLTTEARVTGQGTIAMPLVGQIELGGLTPVDAASRIAARFKKGKFLTDPQVSVALLQVRSRQISVLGQVARPGRYALDEGARVADVLAMAGGITATGDDKVVIITTRDSKPAKLMVDVGDIYRNGDVAANIDLASGDTVFVERAPVFYIQGEIQRAGAYRLEGNLNVMQAISLGGGVTPRGTERGLRIHRRGSDKEVTRIDVKSSDPVQADDVIYVRESLF